MDNVIDYREEAQLCLDETAYALQDGGISNSLPSDSLLCAFLNLTTREGLTFCVCLSSNGFRVSVACFRSKSEQTFGFHSLHDGWVVSICNKEGAFLKVGLCRGVSTE